LTVPQVHWTWYLAGIIELPSGSLIICGKAGQLFVAYPGLEVLPGRGVKKSPADAGLSEVLCIVAIKLSACIR